ncbi:MAG: hypothetical protein ACOY46_00240 [Bacillota bacterium]
MKYFQFWQRWLFIFSLLFTIFGLSLALFNQTVYFDFLFNSRINPLFWDTAKLSGQTAIFQQWIYGVLGATCAGWGIFLAFIINSPFKRRELWAWNCIAAGLTLWFVVDSSISFYFNVFYNVLVNLLLYSLVIIPLLLVRKFFIR